MGLYTQITRSWLEHRFRMHSDGGVYRSHMPIYGVGDPDCERNHVGRLARLLRILRQLDGIDYGTLLDVGGAEGYLPHLARSIHGAWTVTSDLSHEACLRANELFGLPAAAVDSHRLPFEDDAFDVVVCSEVIEHVEYPVETMLELQRVAQRAVILTTEEVRHDRAWIDHYLFRRPGWPHMERNIFHPDDLAACFPDAVFVPQCDERPPDEVAGREEARAWLRQHTSLTTLADGRRGAILIDCVADARRARRHDDETLLERLLDATISKGALVPQAAALDALVPLLRDPATGSPLQVQGAELVSPEGERYPVRAGVPDLVRLQDPAPSRAALAEILERRHPARAAAMLDLRDRLFLPERWTQDYFDFRQLEHRRGFWPNDQLRPRGNDGFQWLAVGPDPWIVTPCLQRPIRELELELRIHAPGNPVEAGTGQVFWKGPGDDNFEEARSVKFRVPNDGQMHVHRVVLADHPRLPEEIQWLRIDPVDGECEVDLLSLRIH